MNEIDLLKRRLDREKRSREAAEDIAEDRLREAYIANQKLLEVKEALHNSNVELEKSLKVKDQFLQTMSHELRTPLNGIMGMAELLSMTIVSGQEQKYLSMLKDCSASLLKMVSAILYYSELSSGQIKAVPTAVSLSHFQTELNTLLSVNESTAIHTDVSVQGDLPSLLYFDADLVKKALQPLIDNAFKFTTAGYVHLSVRGKTVAADLIELTFEVADTGIGIANPVIEELVDRFKQQDASSTREHGGIGLGLSLVKELLGIMNSHVAVKPNTPQGSIFYFSIQCAIKE